MTAIAWSLVGLMPASLDAQGQELRSEIRELRETVHALDVRLTRTGA